MRLRQPRPEAAAGQTKQAFASFTGSAGFAGGSPSSPFLALRLSEIIIPDNQFDPAFDLQLLVDPFYEVVYSRRGDREFASYLFSFHPPEEQLKDLPLSRGQGCDRIKIFTAFHGSPLFDPMIRERMLFLIAATVKDSFPKELVDHEEKSLIKSLFSLKAARGEGKINLPSPRALLLKGSHFYWYTTYKVMFFNIYSTPSDFAL